MTIDPYEATTVSRRPIVGADKPRTLADYQADLVRRFGKVPSWEELAKRENAARVGVNGASTMARPQGKRDLSKAQACAREALTARKVARDAAILEYLEGDYRTSVDVATRFKIGKETAQETMRAMKASGLVVMIRVQRSALWRRAGEMEAAE